MTPWLGHISPYNTDPIAFLLYRALQIRKIATKLRFPTYIPFEELIFKVDPHMEKIVKSTNYRESLLRTRNQQK